MKFQILDKQADVLSIRIDALAGEEEKLLTAIRECRRSAWACPSGECLNIGTMDARAEQGAVLLSLKPRPGVKVSAHGIEECLRYMLHPR